MRSRAPLRTGPLQAMASQSAPMWHRASALAVAIALCLIVGKLALSAMPLGPIAGHMAQHILLMNFLAPAIACAVVALMPRESRLQPPHRTSLLVLAAASQLILLWTWHAPGILPVGRHDMLTHATMQVSLFGVALWFWLELLSVRGVARWRALFALLLTGKLFCLLGVLLVFAPRLLYASPLSIPTEALADQHLAGLLMVVACPLTYVLAGIIIAAQWLREITDRARDPQYSGASRGALADV